MKECRFLTFLSVESVFLTNIDGVRTSSLLFVTALWTWKQTPLGKLEGCMHSSQHISGGMCSAHMVQHPPHGRVLFSSPQSHRSHHQEPWQRQSGAGLHLPVDTLPKSLPSWSYWQTWKCSIRSCFCAWVAHGRKTTKSYKTSKKED